MLDFDGLIKQVQKAFPTLSDSNAPPFYMQLLIKMDMAINAALTDKDSKKKLNKNLNKSLNKLKQRVKKLTREFETSITALIQSGRHTGGDIPVFSPESESEEEDSDDDDDSAQEDGDNNQRSSAADKRTSFARGSADDSDEEEEGGEWTTQSKPSRSKKKGKGAAAKKPEEDWSDEAIDLKLKEMAKKRGLKGTDKNQQLALLDLILSKVSSPFMEIKVLIAITSNQLDAQSSFALPMDAAQWTVALRNVERLVNVLGEQSSFLKDLNDDADAIALEMTDALTSISSATPSVVMGFLERLAEELLKHWQSLEAGSDAYLLRMKDEKPYLAICSRYYEILMEAGLHKQAARAACRQMEGLYMVVNPVPAEDNSGKPILDSEVSQRISALASTCYVHGEERLRVRAALLQAFHYAANGHFQGARDLILMSRVADNLSGLDVQTQILYNRALAMLSLCAFERGDMEACHTLSAELFAQGRARELLGQSLSYRHGEAKSQDQERLEKRRLVAHHLHLPSDTLESAHLTAAMLVEVPNIAIKALDPKRRLVSRTWRKYADSMNRQLFVGPPENSRDIILLAGRSLATGDWSTCYGMLKDLPSWTYLRRGASFQAVLLSKIKEESLRTYLCAYSFLYDSVSLDFLSTRFELKPSHVHSLVSRMMVAEELRASWDQPTSTVVMERLEPSNLQLLALQFAEKAAVFVENNERLLDSRLGGYGFKYDSDRREGPNQASRGGAAYARNGNKNESRVNGVGNNKNQRYEKNRNRRV